MHASSVTVMAPTLNQQMGLCRWLGSLHMWDC